MNLLRLVSTYFIIAILSIGSPSAYLFADIAPNTLPTGGNIVSGNITISTPEVGKMDVNQTSNQGIINWDTFNVGSSAAVHFNQPGIKSSVLNNVLSGTSIINGSIFSNGRLIFVNPSGILTGPTSAIRSEGAILSSLKITNNNFLNNNYSFTTNSSSNITTQGKINGEYVALLSPTITNKGTITTNVATTLAAGDDIRLSISDSNLLTVAVNPSKIKTSIVNEGNIKTQNGIVTLKTDVAQSVVDDVIKTENAKANGLVTENGVVKLVTNSGTIKAKEIEIDAGAKGASEISGALNSNSETEKGGNIEVTAKEIDINAATISADGKTGGGEILLGGDWQGSGDLLQATYINIDDATTISADALESGSGGTIVAWSDIKNANSFTKVSGTLSAKGIDGDGGQIETSGAELDTNGIKIDTSSISGSYGNWLVDPTNLTIGSSEASTYASNLSSTDVTLTADNTITLNNNISYSGSRNSTLTFNATTTVLNANVSSSNGTLSIDINTILEIGATNTTLTTNGGNVDISGVIRAVSGENSNNFTINAGTGNVTFSSNVVKQAGDYSAGVTQGSFTNESDLDFSGTFLNAINIAGNAVTVGDASFQRGHAGYNTLNSNEGNWQHQITSWNATAWSSSGLTELMRGIRWSWGNQVSPYVQFTNATVGQKYKIQALFKERCCNRYFDVYVDGTKIADDFKPQLSGGNGGSTGRYLTYQFEASSSNVMFRMSGRTAENSGSRLHGNDVNPILNAISIEAVDAGASINNLSITANQFSAQAIEVGGDLTVTNSGNSTISGVISGDTALTKAGSGQLTTSANNTYTGGTTVSAGTLFGGGGSRTNDVFGTGAITVASGATLWVDRSDDGALTNALTLNGGTLYGTNGFGQYWDGNITLGAHSTIRADNNFYIDGVISGSSKNLTKTGTGAVILRGTNTYSGTTTVSAGTLNIGGSGSLGSGTYAGNISNSGTFAYSSSTAQTLSGVISGSGALTKSGSSTLTLSGTNTYSGITRVNSGTVSISSLSNLGNSTATLAGGTLKTTSSITTGNGTVINLDGDSSVEVGSGTFNLKGKFLGNGRLTKTGSGTLTLGNSSQNNNWSGGLTINAGKVKALKDRAFGAIPDNFDSDNIIVENGSSIDFGTVSFTFNSNRGISLANSGSNSGFIVGKSRTISIPGVISGDGGLTKTGQGVLDIQGANTYTGDTAVNNGNLKVSGSLGSGSYAGNISVSDTRSINYAGSSTQTFSGTISGEGKVIQSGSGQLVLTGTNTYSGSTTISAGTLTLSGSGNLGNGSYAGAIVNNGTFKFDTSANLISTGVISGSGSVLVTGTGTYEPKATNTYTGGTVIDGGIIAAFTDRNWGAYPGSVDSDNIILKNGGKAIFGSKNSSNTAGHTYWAANRGINLPTSGQQFIEMGSGGSGAAHIQGVVNGIGGITFTRSGSKTIRIFGENTYTGDTKFNFTSGSNNNISTIPKAFQNSTVYLSTTRTNVGRGFSRVSGSGNIILGGLAGDMSGWRLAGGLNIEFGSNNANTSVAGGISQYAAAGKLIKKGTGTTTFTATSGQELNSSSIGLQIDAGKLVLNGDWGRNNTAAGTVAIAAGATLAIDTAQNNTYSGVLSGAGTLLLGGTGTSTFSGNNTFSGALNIADGGFKAGHANSFGSATVTSSGGRISTASSITLPSLTVTGNVQLDSGITTTGAQIYNNNVVVKAGTRASAAVITANNSDISFKGTLKGEGNAKARSLTINAGTGNILFGDRVGYAFNGQTVNINNTADSFYKMTVTGNEITVKGDVMTYEEQTYNGNVLVGSTASNGTTRTFLSMDPKVIFNGTVNDTIKGKHTLIAKAVEIDRGVNSTPSVDFKSTVGGSVALANYQGLTGYQTSGANWGVIDASNPIGTTTGTGQKMGSTSSSSNDNDRASRGVAQIAKTFKTESSSNIFEIANFRFGGKGNTLSFRKNVDIIYGDSPEFGAPTKVSRSNTRSGSSNQGGGLFGRFFGKSNPDIGPGPLNPNSPEFSSEIFKPRDSNNDNNFRQPKDIRETFKDFKGGEGKFFNPYALENQKQRQESSPSNNQDIRLEDEES